MHAAVLDRCPEHLRPFGGNKRVPAARMERQRCPARLPRKRRMMLHALPLIGMLLFSSAYAAEEETLYMKIKAQVEEESRTEEAELVIQRFALGIYYDNELQATKVDADGKKSMTPFEMRKEEFVDYALKRQDWYLCDFEDDGSTISDYLTCLLVQKSLNKIVTNNAWHRVLGRDLPMIAS